MTTGTTVKNTVRAQKLKAKWDDPTVGADGLTYRQRMTKAAKEHYAARGGIRRKRTDPTPPPEPAPTPTPAPSDPPPAEKKTMRGWAPWQKRTS
jgi:hypothetical protein